MHSSFLGPDVAKSTHPDRLRTPCVAGEVSRAHSTSASAAAQLFPPAVACPRLDRSP